MVSRLHKVGTIYSRVAGLLEKNGVPKENKPLWFDVYERFPPKYEPTYSRPAPNIEIKEILYPEDTLRAKLQQIFSKNLGLENLNVDFEPKVKRWMKLYNASISSGKSEEEAINELKESILGSPQVTESENFKNPEKTKKADMNQVFTLFEK